MILVIGKHNFLTCKEKVLKPEEKNKQTNKQEDNTVYLVYIQSPKPGKIK